MFIPSVLLFNEDPCYLSNLTKNFQRAHYLVTPVGRSAEVLEQLQREQFDLLILDICPCGWEKDRFLAEVRCISAYIPMVAITETPCLETALHALRYRVYDYLGKSVPFDDLLLRIQEILLESRNNIDHLAILNQMQALLDNLRSAELKTTVQTDLSEALTAEVCASSFSRGPYKVNLSTREVICGEKQIILSPTEFNYWVALLRHEPEVISYKLLVKEAQSYDLGGREAMNLARWHIHGLRRIFENKLGKDPIQTIRGVGYRVLV